MELHYTFYRAGRGTRQPREYLFYIPGIALCMQSSADSGAPEKEAHRTLHDRTENRHRCAC